MVIPSHFLLTCPRYKDQCFKGACLVEAGIFKMAMKTKSVFLKAQTPTPTKRHRTTPIPCTPQHNERRRNAVTPQTTPGDRYVPSRAGTDLEFARFLLNTPSKNLDENSPTCEANRSLMRDKLLALKGQSSDNRVMSFHQQISPSGACEFQS